MTLFRGHVPPGKFSHNEAHSLLGQGRLDGAFCDFTNEDKMAFLKRVHDKGIVNIEMESLCFAAMAHRAGVRSKYTTFDCISHG